MTRVLIIGGGVAGPVTAMALQRADIDAVVYEAHAPTTQEVGSCLTVATNGIDAHRPALAAGSPIPTNMLWSSSGRRLGAVSNGGVLPDGTTAHTVKRARLYRALHQQAAARGLRIKYGRRLIDAQVTPDGVTACFADGATAAGDLLVGADGVHSATRRLIDPAAPGPRYVGLVNFGGYTPGSAGAAEPGVWHMIFGRHAFFGYVVDPTGGTVWFANVPRPAVSAAERSATTVEQWQRQLVGLFATDRGSAADLIAAGTLELAADNTYDLPRVPTWHKGPMVVIGDAAHPPSPSSGQGASMAAVDAVLLAKSLRDLPDLPRALDAYERLRRRRVERIVAQGARSSSSKTPGPVGRFLRDLLLPVVFRFLVTDRSWRGCMTTTSTGTLPPDSPIQPCHEQRQRAELTDWSPVAPARFAAMSWDTVRAASRPCCKGTRAAMTRGSHQALEGYVAAIRGSFCIVDGSNRDAEADGMVRVRV